MALAAKRAAIYPPFNLRTKIGSFEWGGAILDGSPGSTPPPFLRLIVNGRLRSGMVIPRGGQAKLTPAALQASDACVRGIFDFQIGTPKKLFVVGDGCPGVHASNGFSSSAYDQEGSPPYQPVIYYDTATVSMVAAPFDGEMYLGVDDDLRRVQQASIPYGETGLDLGGASQDIFVQGFSASGGITAMQGFDGRLFIAVDNGAGASYVTTWNTVSEVLDLESINAPSGFGIWRDKLILGYPGSPNHIRVRDVGAPPGTWATVAPGAGTANFHEGISYKGVFYFTTLDEDLFSFDGTTLTRIPVATTGIDAASVTFGIEVFDGKLIVAYTTPGNDARLITYDGSTWSPVAKDFTLDIGATVTSARAVRAFRNDLYVALIRSGVGELYRSALTAITGSYTRIQQDVGGTAGSINQLLVY